jgi:hypothetical protein
VLGVGKKKTSIIIFKRLKCKQVFWLTTIGKVTAPLKKTPGGAHAW